MRESFAQLTETDERNKTLSLLAAVSCAAILLCGCAAQKKPAIPWRTAVLVRPLVPEPSTASESEEIPDIEAEIPAPEPLVVVQKTPTRPRVPAPPAVHETQSEKPDMPRIVPELSAQESNALQQETQQNLGDAERNVTTASRKALNPAQTDLASKVRGFISDAREAEKVGDWSRARDLAKKAQVLSEELINSL
jgi:hypothetical protein